MTDTPRPKVGIFGLTGCAGDQLQILNCEEQLLWLASQVDIVDWVMAKSDNDHNCALDIAFVEGVVATEQEHAHQALVVRKRCRGRCKGRLHQLQLALICQQGAATGGNR